MKTKQLIVIFILSFTLNTLKAQVFFNNKYNEPVWVVLGYPVDTKAYKGWVTVGWYEVAPGENKEILNYNPTGQYIYYYAQTKGGVKKFEGANYLLADPKKAFNIKNADKEYVQNENPSYKWYKFRQIDKGAKDMFKLKYTIAFEY
ncbi:MAG: hypothetical protein JWP12_3321 [Bacteroidetes bacterium]|nr:hypothetical protein [Bacteroidota bacterium]